MHDAAPPKPTTQELVSGKYSPIRLDTLPLILMVPTGWKLNTEMGTIVLLEGPTPSTFDRAQIQLSRRDHFTPEELEILHTGAKREQESDPQAQMQIELRDLAGMKVLERRSVGRQRSFPVTDASGVGKLDEKGQPIMHISTPMRWKLNVFVPSGGGYDQYELNFIDLSVEQYKADKDFLERIINSLSYDGMMPLTTTGK